TTPRPPPNDEPSQADARLPTPQHRTKPPAPAPQPPAIVGSPPRAHARRCTPPAPQHQDRISPHGAGSRPPEPLQPPPPPASTHRLPPPPAANATRRDDQAQPAAHRSDRPRANTPAPAAAAPDETARLDPRAPAASA